MFNKEYYIEQVTEADGSLTYEVCKRDSDMFVGFDNEEDAISLCNELNAEVH